MRLLPIFGKGNGLGAEIHETGGIWDGGLHLEILSHLQEKALVNDSEELGEKKQERCFWCWLSNKKHGPALRSTLIWVPQHLPSHASCPTGPLCSDGLKQVLRD